MTNKKLKSDERRADGPPSVWNACSPSRKLHCRVTNFTHGTCRWCCNICDVWGGRYSPLQRDV